MEFKELSPNAEKLLQEILEHHEEATAYWKNRFDNLSFDNEARLCSLFKELKENDMIATKWADNIPYLIAVSDKGYTYAELKKKHMSEKKKMNRREWLIAIVAAIIGAAIGLIPTIIQWIGGK